MHYLSYDGEMSEFGEWSIASEALEYAKTKHANMEEYAEKLLTEFWRELPEYERTAYRTKLFAGGRHTFSEVNAALGVLEITTKMPGDPYLTDNRAYHWNTSSWGQWLKLVNDAISDWYLHNGDFSAGKPGGV